MKLSPVFEQTYRRYLAQVAEVDLGAAAETLGATLDEDALLVRLFGRTYRVSGETIVDEEGRQPIHSVSVVLARYVILCPESVPAAGDWVTYKDFRDAAPFVGGFVNNSEKAIANHFGGRLDVLRRACEGLGGTEADMQVSYELVRRFDGLPRVPLVLLYNDQDEEFPAESTILFEKRAERFLDMECLAILGWLLADELKRAVGEARETVM